MYLPINTDGYFNFMQSEEAAGWYQLDVVGATLPVLDGIPIAQAATAMLVQAVTQLDFCLSPAATAGNPASMQLAAGQTLWLPGRPSIAALCIKLGVSGGSFLVQLYQGTNADGPIIQ